MTEGGLKAWGMTEVPLCLSVIPPAYLSYRQSSLSCPPVSPLSFPPVVSGNPVSCFVVLLFVWGCMGKAMDSRLKMSGMTEGELTTSGMTEEGLTTSGMTEGLVWLSDLVPMDLGV